MELSGNPGLGDITKQYLYQLALSKYISENEFSEVKNALIFPNYDDGVENLGTVKIEILNELDLEDIQVIMLPAKEANKMYLENRKLKISELELKDI